MTEVLEQWFAKSFFEGSLHDFALLGEGGGGLCNTLDRGNKGGWKKNGACSANEREVGSSAASKLVSCRLLLIVSAPHFPRHLSWV